MMAKTDSSPHHRLREAPRWARRYAQTRARPLLVVALAYLVLLVSLVFLADRLSAHRATERPPVTTSLLENGAAGVVAFAVVFSLCFTESWIAVRRWGGKSMVRVDERLYEREGYTALGDASGVHGHPRAGGRTAAAFLAAILEHFK